MTTTAPVLDRILHYAADQPFAESVLDLVAETTHEHVLADHLLAALVSRPGSREYTRLQRAGWQPEELRSIIVTNIPIAARPSRPPARVTAETLDPRLIARCEGGTDVAGVLVGCLTEEVREVLQFGTALRQIEEAFAEAEETAVALDPPAFFDADGRLQRERFRGNALALIESVERASTELGYEKISLPQLFVGAARTGLLKGYITAFTRSYAAVLDGVERQVRKAPLAGAVTLSAATCSTPMKRYVARVEALAQERTSEVIDEVILLLALLDQDSEILAGYWRAFGVDRRHAARTIAAMKDESPVNPRPSDALPDFNEIYERLCSRIVGQREPVAQIMPLVKAWMARVRFPEQPAGVALLMGPSGVGKTELSKEIAELLFGDRRKLCFVEMNTMGTEESINRLIGAPPGYVAMGEGIVTNWLAENPDSIILFDEVEKAHPKCFQAMLRLLSEGRIQDGRGREYDGNGALIILTSNIGQNEGVFERIAADRADGLHESRAVKDPRIQELLRRQFSKEFINRFQDVILFNPLIEDDYREIARLACDAATRTLFDALALRIHVDPASYTALANEALDLRQGARGMRNVAQSMKDIAVEYRVQHPDATDVTIVFKGDAFVTRG